MFYAEVGLHSINTEIHSVQALFQNKMTKNVSEMSEGALVATSLAIHRK